MFRHVSFKTIYDDSWHENGDKPKAYVVLWNEISLFCKQKTKKLQVIAETIATYLLVFVTSGSATLSASNEQMVSKLRALVAGGMIVTVMIYVVGHISGAHMNPAVTLAFSAVRHFPTKFSNNYICLILDNWPNNEVYSIYVVHVEKLFLDSSKLFIRRIHVTISKAHCR